jgi:hypothetical protein
LHCEGADAVKKLTSKTIGVFLPDRFSKAMELVEGPTRRR